MRASADRRKDDGLCHVTASEGASPPKWLSPERLRRVFLKVSVASPARGSQGGTVFHSQKISGTCAAFA